MRYVFQIHDSNDKRASGVLKCIPQYKAEIHQKVVFDKA
jgi:hypothetical protein